MLKQNKYFVAYLNYLVKGGRTRGWKVEPRLKEIQMVSVKTSLFFHPGFEIWLFVWH